MSDNEGAAATTGPRKKKRSKSVKKSLAAQHEKRQQSLDTLLRCEERLPSFVLEVLREEERERGQILKLSVDEMERFWAKLQKFLMDEVRKLLAPGGSSDNSNIDVTSALTWLLQHSTMCHDATGVSCFIEMVVALSLAMESKTVDAELRSEICQLCEYCCCVRKLRFPGEVYLYTFNYLFDLTLDGKPDTDLKPAVKRMWDMHVVLAHLNLRTHSCEGIVAKLTRVVVSPLYLSCKEGRQFVAFTFTLDTKLIRKFHQAVKDFLPTCKRQQASSYGEVYYSAWINGSAEVKEVLEVQCIQNFMTHVFKFPRKQLEVVHTGQNVQAILSYFHRNRSPNFSKKLTELYMPLLWRHLRSGNNMERCNAAEVFLDAYPLEKGEGRVQDSEFLQKQHTEMVDLLTDDCHIVRVIAVKGICCNLSTVWGSFPQESVQVLMRNLLVLSNDASNTLVRRTLYEGLSVMLQNPDCAKYLGLILPSMHEYLNDVNEKVRRAFVKMLLAVHALPEPAPIKYWKVVSVENLASRLELEKAEVGTVLSKLLMSSIYWPETPVDKFLHRLFKFIEINPNAARKLFQFSSSALNCSDAVRVMLTILLNLRAFVRQKEESFLAKADDEQERKSEKVSKRKKRRSGNSMETITENDENEPDNSQVSSRVSNSSVSSESSAGCNKGSMEYWYRKPGMVHALVDIVSILWSLHANQLAGEKHEKDHNNLIDIASVTTPLFLKYFKGDPIYFAVIHLASMVPISKLVPVSTVCSACASHLKQVSEMTPDSEIAVIVNALCAWNRFADIQDIVVDWLDQAFRCEGLNQSQAPVTEQDKQRKVRFVARGGKPMLALKLLDTVFGHPTNSTRVLKKSYNQVYELYTYLERIKVLVERRVIQNLPFDSPMLSDEFLQKCLYRYTKLMLILHRPMPPPSANNETVVEPFNASDVFREFVQWTMLTIRPLIPQKLEEEPDASVLFLKDILRTAANLIDLDYAEEKCVYKIGELILGLLSSNCSLWFVEHSIIITKLLKDLSQARHGRKDGKLYMEKIVPSLLSQVLKALSVVKYTKEEICGCMQSLHEVKTSMFEVLVCVWKLFPGTAILEAVLKLLTDAIIAVLNHDVLQLQLLDTVDKIQELPFVCGLLLAVVTRPMLAPLWLATVPSSISETYYQESNLLGAVVSLLHTLAHSGLSLPQAELAAAVREAYLRVTEYTRESTRVNTTSNLSESGFSTDSIDVKNLALPVLSELATFLNCPLR